MPSVMEDDDREIELGDENAKGSFWGNFVLIVVTLAFVIAAFSITKMTFGPLVRSALATQWQPATGVIETSFVDMPARRQYRIEARYAYDWEGERLTSEQVFFDDTVGLRKTYYHEINRQLLRHKSPENPITVWVNPGAPDQAVLFRAVRWDKFAGNLLLFLIWAGITKGLVGSSIAVLRK
ncbi:MAG: DUF3592 domain-containing protein [Silicimonas sp.]|nr:DUF3592 domain-containing protein [Silicimonas sp.]